MTEPAVSARPSSAPGTTRLVLALVLAAVAVAVALRWPGLGRRAPFIDEAESAVNALTILDHGVPIGRYLGLPIYENTLTEPWPENAEYAFRDSSYSERGLAVYHGWLPLYAIAVSSWALGARPDAEPQGELRVLRSQAEIERRIFAARFPSLVFAAGFVIALFLAGRSLYGADAGLAAAWAGALSKDCVELGSQARYYSATLALAVVAGFAVWRLRSDEKLRDWLFVALALAALFHTHLLAFAVLAVLATPRVARSLAAGRAPLVVPALALLVGLTAPWLVFTGYFEGSGGGPPARELLELRDYWAYFAARTELAACLAAAVAVGAAMAALRHRLPPRAAQAFREALPGLGFVAAWLVVAYFGFLLLMPAASAFFWRLTLAILPAGLLLAGIGTAVAVRSVLARGAVVVAPLALSLALIVSGRAFAASDRYDLPNGALRELIDRLRGHEFPAGTRLYSLPNQHLVLQWTTGLPVQSVAPVRREFVERFPGEVVLLETTDPWPPLRSADVLACAERAGERLDSDRARSWTERLRTRLRREDLAERVAEISPPLEPASQLPAWTACVLATQRARHEEGSYGIDFASHNPAMLRDCTARDFASFWPAFFYRFADPQLLAEVERNFAARAARAKVEVLDSGWAVYRCPPSSAARGDVEVRR